MFPRALCPKMGQARHRAPSLSVQGTRRSQLMKHAVSSRKTSLPDRQEHHGDSRAAVTTRVSVTPKAAPGRAGYSEEVPG